MTARGATTDPWQWVADDVRLVAVDGILDHEARSLDVPVRFQASFHAGFGLTVQNATDEKGPPLRFQHRCPDPGATPVAVALPSSRESGPVRYSQVPSLKTCFRCVVAGVAAFFVWWRGRYEGWAGKVSGVQYWRACSQGKYGNAGVLGWFLSVVLAVLHIWRRNCAMECADMRLSLAVAHGILRVPAGKSAAQPTTTTPCLQLDSAPDTRSESVDATVVPPTRQGVVVTLFIAVLHGTVQTSAYPMNVAGLRCRDREPPEAGRGVVGLR